MKIKYKQIYKYPKKYQRITKNKTSIMLLSNQEKINIPNKDNKSLTRNRKEQKSLYLYHYQKYFNKKLVIKYNILPNEYNLMKLDNFIKAKFCHSLSSFKELLIFNYQEEFLKNYYSLKDSIKKLPLFSDFYKSYLQFFCFPTLCELKLNELIEDNVEKKAKAFYNDNYNKEENNNKKDKKLNIIFFTTKIREKISKKSSLKNLTKTTIKSHNITNKSSKSIISIKKIVEELDYGQNKISLMNQSEKKSFTFQNHKKCNKERPKHFK